MVNDSPGRGRSGDLVGYAIMKIFLYIVLGLVVILGGAVIAAPMLISESSMRDMVVTTVKQQTGRDLKIDGTTRFSIFPNLGVEASKVMLSSPEGFGRRRFITMDRINVKLDLISTLTGRPSVESFVLIKPRINLVVDKSGRGNWALDKKTGRGDRGGGGAGGVNVSNFKIGKFAITDGEFTYDNAQTGAKAIVHGINLNLAMGAFNSALTGKGSLVLNGETVRLDARLATPAALMAGRQAALKGTLKAPHIAASFEGAITMGKAPVWSGKIALNTKSARKLAAWLGTPLAAGRGLGALDVKARLSAKGDMIGLRQAVIGLDGMKLAGDADIRLIEPRPFVKANLRLDKLDLNQYLAQGPGADKGGGSQGWSDQRIDYSGLKAVDGELKLATQIILYKKVKTGASTLTVRLRGGLVTASLPKLALYKGAANAVVTLDGRTATPALKAKGKVQNVDALPLFSDAAGMTKLEGKANLTFDLTTAGVSQKKMMAGLNGKAALNFTNGAIRGVDIAAMLGAVQKQVLQGWNDDGGKKTRFASLTANYDFKNGKGTNKDFKMLGPRARVIGAGSVTMPAQTLFYKVNPTLVSGKGIQVLGMKVPIIIAGRWSNPQIYPDLPNILENPAAAFKAFGNVGQTGADGIGGLIKKVVPGDGSGPTEPVGKALKGLKKIF
jgi:AsmA protein